MEEVAKHAELFEESVKTYPETIACRNQNLPLGRFYWPDDDKWDTPSLEKYKMGMKKLKMLSGYESRWTHLTKYSSSTFMNFSQVQMLSGVE